MANRTGNRILDLLPGDELIPLLASAQSVSLQHGHEIARQDGPQKYVYFPTTGVFGSVLLMGEGKQIETATIGSEGMLGLPLFLGLDFSIYTVLCQVPGNAVRVPAAPFTNATRPGTTLERLLRRYTAFHIRCTSQTVACNALHSVEERMCRWLLMAHDRAGVDEFLLTQEFLSELLGVRRQTVSIIAGTLQNTGLIRYRRGLLRVFDRKGLESTSCECYAVTKRIYERIMH